MRVMPPTLMLMMRHESIQTTQKYYVGWNADVAAETIWEALANAFANSDPLAGENAFDVDSIGALD